MSWTQPICIRCWRLREGDRVPTRIVETETEACCLCGQPTSDGIYIRIDPKTVKYPSGD